MGTGTHNVCAGDRLPAFTIRTAQDAATMPSKDLLDLLVCPLGHAPLRLEGEFLVCTRCGPRFAIEDDIPNMLVEEATLPPGCGSLQDLECIKSGDARADLG